VDFQVQIGQAVSPLYVKGARDPSYDKDSNTVGFRTVPTYPTDPGSLLLAVAREQLVYIEVQPPTDPPAS